MTPPIKFSPSGGGAIVGGLGEARIAIFRHPGQIDVIVTDGGERAHAGIYASEPGFKKRLRAMIAEGHDGTYLETRRRWSADAVALAERDWLIGDTAF